MPLSKRPGRRDTLCPPQLPDEPLTDDGRPHEGEIICPLVLPGTDVRCSKHIHPDTTACHATGMRGGYRFSAFWWRPM
jgi:hypothetical protein